MSLASLRGVASIHPRRLDFVSTQKMQSFSASDSSMKSGSSQMADVIFVVIDFFYFFFASANPAKHCECEFPWKPATGHTPPTSRALAQMKRRPPGHRSRVAPLVHNRQRPVLEILRSLFLSCSHILWSHLHQPAYAVKASQRHERILERVVRLARAGKSQRSRYVVQVQPRLTILAHR